MNLEFSLYIYEPWARLEKIIWPHYFSPSCQACGEEVGTDNESIEVLNEMSIRS